MNREDIIRMAREADREWDCDRDMVEWLEWFAALVAAAEREACAKAYEAEAGTWNAWPQAGAAKRKGATAIRARGQA